MYKGCSSYLGIILYLLDVFSIEEEHKTIKESPVIICASCKIKQANKYLLKPLLVTTIENNTKSTQKTVRESIKIYNQSDEAKLYMLFLLLSFNKILLFKLYTISYIAPNIKPASLFIEK